MQLGETLLTILNELSDEKKQNFMQEDGDETPFNNQGINVKCIDHYGGEDQGSEYYAVYSFSKDNEERFVKFQGWYASSYGSEYQGWNFVTPQEKTITVYE